MPLDANQLAVLRSRLGSNANEADLSARYDRLGDLVAVEHEVLSQRLADLLASPATFSVPGEYSQSTGENIRALQARIDALPIGGTSTATVLDASRRWPR